MNLRNYILIIFFTMVLSSCGRSSVHFDEAQWRKDVEKQRIENLYATHFKDGKYFNPWMPAEQGRFWEFLKWRLSRKDTYTDEERSFKATLVSHLIDRIKSLPDVNFISWVGHNTFLMRIHGQYWLTDPIFSKRALIPKRLTPPAINVNELTELTDSVNVIITHNHYDHLDVKSIGSLPDQSCIFVPRGLKEYVASIHNHDVRELDWWESIDLKEDVKLVCLPAQHWSRRIGQGINSTLWASYMLITPETTIYVGGDSGYFVGYREIGRRFQNIDYALIPLTAYHPRWFMHYAHMNAHEAVNAFRDLGAQYFIPTQWGTFKLGDNPPGYPALELTRIIKEKSLDPSRFLIMDIGQIQIIPPFRQ
ncbi:MAG: MBL fold metallo-hydrolase [Desulfatiglandales bacterium]